MLFVVIQHVEGKVYWPLVTLSRLFKVKRLDGDVNYILGQLWTDMSP